MNFEKCYWIPGDSDNFKDFKLNPELIRRKFIYKDTYQASKEVWVFWILNQFINKIFIYSEDYYLRPNACIALSVAPELFLSKERVLRYMHQIERLLIKDDSLGIKTLDPKERVYYPVYDNSDDSDKINYAHGFSYHNVKLF